MNDTKRNLILLANEFLREHNTSTCQTHRFVRQFTKINKVFCHSLFEFIYNIESVRRIFHGPEYNVRTNATMTNCLAHWNVVTLKRQIENSVQ